MNHMQAQRRTRIKFCGMAHPDDVDAAVSLGVDALGFIFAPSPRRLDLGQARDLLMHVPPLVSTVAVFVDPDDVLYRQVAAIMPRMIPQFCGTESPERCAELAGSQYMKVMHVEATTTPGALTLAAQRYSRALLVFDTKSAAGGGSGMIFDWSILPPPPVFGMIAGGLHPENVAACVKRTRPLAVDVRSGIENDGRKDYRRMEQFIAAVRAADEENLSS